MSSHHIVRDDQEPPLLLQTGLPVIRIIRSITRVPALSNRVLDSAIERDEFRYKS
jgi:hypothetical protein